MEAQRLVFFENRKLVTFEGGMEQYEQALAANRPKEDLRLLEITILMRMAALACAWSTSPLDRPFNFAGWGFAPSLS